MRKISIDIETYSDIDLTKCGVYKYVESPNFAVLLFGYSIDEGAVQVVDLANGEKIPDEVLAALEDENVIKWAYNANFERVCLSRFLGYPAGKYLSPIGWKCSKIWAAYLGLPQTLKAVGAALGLENQKLDDGKALIRLFPCLIRMANGQCRKITPKSGYSSKNTTSVMSRLKWQYRAAWRSFPCRNLCGKNIGSTKR